MNLNDSFYAEQSVLGAVIRDSKCIDEIIFLESRDFLDERNELIWKVMKYLYERELPIDIITITAEYQKFKRVEDMGGVSYLSNLASAVPTSANVRYYANIVRSKGHRKRIKDLAKKLDEAADGDYESDDELFAAVDELVDETRPQKVSNMRSFAETRTSYYDHLKHKAAKLFTGLFKQFDEWAMLWIGWLYIIAGRPGVGKTAKALQLAYGIAKFNPNAGPVLIYSQEMDENEVKDRMVAMVAEVNYPRLINKGGEGGFTENEWAKINAAYDEIEKLNIYVQDSAGVTIDEIRATARAFKKKYGKIAAIIVDYLQIMEIPQRKNENRAQAIGRVTRTAKQIARNMKFVFILLSQLDRSADDEEPKLRHLKESGSIEQDADVVEFLWFNPKSQMQKGLKIIDSIFAKGRNVGLNRFKYIFRWWHQKYVEVPKEKEDK
ncbi:replicative DNA helicase [Paenibacillus albiflavus]|uniref:DNA 5'-3' helicase n=1 Tax=Paenibacillus albiflavus TaxID=2545760 RepID=A0A4R4ED50_9BACL|nr:DnaB-like helicase C-terminal domain-containing protein [Paenibacillus albiflavus]TCZ76081.1 replicative DNA helicase [Paenibacillus albiflavus]